MKKEETSLEVKIKSVAKRFAEEIKDQEIQVISHFDTDGITSAAIMIQALKKLDKKFSIKIVKNLEKEFIKTLAKDKLTIFLDLASSNINTIKEHFTKEVFIIDHHEIDQEIPEGINIINPELHNQQKISSSCLTYLFCKQINSENKELAKLAILGMIGDILEKNIDKLNNGILEDGDIKKKRGLLIYPSTRPLNRTLEFCSNPYIPGVTGNIKGVFELLREVNLTPVKGKYKSLIELDDEEMERLVTAIMLRNPKTKNREMLGDIFLIKLFNKLEDARELSAMINACSRLGRSDIAIQLCMEIPEAKKKAEAIHARYKQFIISGLKFASETEKTQGKDFIIINAKDKIKDTMAGTIAGILSKSSLYEEGTIIITMAYYNDGETSKLTLIEKDAQEISSKIKISARMVGENGRNVREILKRVVDEIGGEVGGHAFAAGAMISQTKEHEFIDLLKKNLELEIVKI
ncbi:MAG: DHH family phosphoesterase [Nanoarchaeota archaeon]|nr:DHH family phosphoesterase [Nanoarchaeota archaeon]